MESNLDSFTKNQIGPFDVGVYNSLISVRQRTSPLKTFISQELIEDRHNTFVCFHDFYSTNSNEWHDILQHRFCLLKIKLTQQSTRRRQVELVFDYGAKAYPIERLFDANELNRMYGTTTGSCIEGVSDIYGRNVISGMSPPVMEKLNPNPGHFKLTFSTSELEYSDYITNTKQFLVNELALFVIRPTMQNLDGLDNELVAHNNTMDKLILTTHKINALKWPSLEMDSTKITRLCNIHHLAYISHGWETYPIPLLMDNHVGGWVNAARDGVSRPALEDARHCSLREVIHRSRDALLRARMNKGRVAELLYSLPQERLLRTIITENESDLQPRGDEQEEIEENPMTWGLEEDDLLIDTNPMGIWPSTMSTPLNKIRVGTGKARKTREEYDDLWGYIAVVFNNMAMNTKDELLPANYNALEPLTPGNLRDHIMWSNLLDDEHEEPEQPWEWAWEPIPKDRDYITHKTYSSLQSEEGNHQLWTNIGVEAHERLFVYALMGKYDISDDEYGIKPEEYGESEKVKTQSIDDVFPATKFDMVDGQCKFTDTDLLDLDDQNVIRLDRNQLCTMCPKLDPTSKLNGMYDWARPYTSSPRSLVKAYADNSYLALREAVNTTGFKEANWPNLAAHGGEVEIKYVLPEYPVSWPYGTLGKDSKLRGGLNGYETRIDCMCVLTLQGKPIVAVVEYKMRMELMPRVDRGNNAWDAANNFCNVLMGNSRDKLQAESNAWLYYLNTGIIPTVAIVVNGTRRLPMHASDSNQLERVSRRVTPESCGCKVRGGSHPIPCCYVAFKPLDFRRRYLLSLLDRLVARPLGKSTFTSYADQNYVIPDLVELEKKHHPHRMRPNTWNVEKGNVDSHLQTMMVLLPKCALVRATLLVCAACEVYFDSVEALVADDDLFAKYKGIIWGDTNHGRTGAPRATTLTYTMYAELGERQMQPNYVVALDTQTCTLVASAESSPDQLLEAEFNTVHTEPIYFLVSTGAVASGSSRETLMAYVGGGDVAIADLLIPGPVVAAMPSQSGAAFIRNLFRPHSVIVDGCSLYPSTEPAECKRLREQVNDHVLKQATHITSKLMRYPNIAEMGPEDFMVLTLRAVQSRRGGLWGQAAQEFTGWEHLFRDDATDNGGLPGHSMQNYHKLHPLQKNRRGGNSLQKHKKVSLIRSIHRLVNQRMLRGLCGFYGYDIDSVDPVDLRQLDIFDDVDFLNAQYDETTMFDLKDFAHSSNRAQWHVNALRSIQMPMYGEETMISMAANHICHDIETMVQQMGSDYLKPRVTRSTRYPTAQPMLYNQTRDRYSDSQRVAASASHLI